MICPPQIHTSIPISAPRTRPHQGCRRSLSSPKDSAIVYLNGNDSRSVNRVERLEDTKYKQHFGTRKRSQSVGNIKCIKTREENEAKDPEFDPSCVIKVKSPEPSLERSKSVFSEVEDRPSARIILKGSIAFERSVSDEELDSIIVSSVGPEQTVEVRTVKRPSRTLRKENSEFERENFSSQYISADNRPVSCPRDYSCQVTIGNNPKKILTKSFSTTVLENDICGSRQTNPNDEFNVKIPCVDSRKRSFSLDRSRTVEGLKDVETQTSPKLKHLRAPPSKPKRKSNKLSSTKPKNSKKSFENLPDHSLSLDVSFESLQINTTTDSSSDDLCQQYASLPPDLNSKASNPLYIDVEFRTSSLSMDSNTSTLTAKSTQSKPRSRSCSPKPDIVPLSGHHSNFSDSWKRSQSVDSKASSDNVLRSETDSSRTDCETDASDGTYLSLSWDFTDTDFLQVSLITVKISEISFCV